MAIKPLADRVVVKLVAAEEKTKSGIVLPDTVKEKPQEAKVLAVGPGKMLDNGTRVVMEVKAGDIVAFSKYSGTEIKVDGEELMILNEKDILGIIE